MANAHRELCSLRPFAGAHAEEEAVFAHQLRRGRGLGNRDRVLRCTIETTPVPSSKHDVACMIAPTTLQTCDACP
jgi:hypothetical protein